MLRSREFIPEPRGFREAKALAKAGYEVHVLAWDRSAELPKKETREGISIHRSHIPCKYNDFLTFAFMLPLFWLWCLLRIYKLRPSVIHCADLDTLPVGAIAKRLRGTKVVYDAYENYAGMVRQSVPNSVARGLASLQDRLLLSSDAVITVSPRFASTLQHGAIIIPNVPSIAEYENVTKEDIDRKHRELCPEGKTLVSYLGIWMAGRGLDHAIEAFKQLPDHVLIIGGFGHEEEHIRALAKGCENVKFIGWVSLVPLFTKASDAVLLYLDPSNENYRDTWPNKVFEAMNAGVPLITSKGTASGELVEEQGCGVAVEYGSPEKLAEAIRSLTKERMMALGNKGLELARTKYSWERYEKELIEIYRRIEGAEK